MKEYIKLPKTKIIPDSSIEKQQLSDADWINYIFHIILKYNSIDKEKIINLVQEELKKQHSQVEELIKNHIYTWYKKAKKTDKQIAIWRIILNLEPKSNSLKGFYDLKFQHSDWDKYFVFEAKNLGEIKSQSQSASINEYVYNQAKKDGGMYRFFTGKYAFEFNFGGMLGFIVGKNNNLKTKLIDKIENVYKNGLGQLADNKIIINSIAENSNTFETIHKRKNFISKKDEKFHLYHIILDFTNEEK